MSIVKYLSKSKGDRKFAFQATCKKFYNFCSTHGVALSRRNFTLRYDTNIPRQVQVNMNANSVDNPLIFC